jgi:hypothetical protein
VAEPVTLDEAKNFLRVTIDDDDALITSLIVAAREACEAFTDRSFCIKGYRQSLDSFPYFTDTMLSQMAYPPSYYSLPRYSTTLWNYSQMIKLFRPPLVSVDRITYLSSKDKQYHDLVPSPLPWYPGRQYNAASVSPVVPADQVTDNLGQPNNPQVNPGNIQVCITSGISASDPPDWNPVVGGITTESTGVQWINNGPAPNGEFGTFLVDKDSEPARIFPGPPGNFWPPVLYVPNAVQIHFRAGYSLDGSLVPKGIKTAMLLLIANYYENREAAMPGMYMEVPNHIKMLLWSHRVYDMQPTRG